MRCSVCRMAFLFGDQPRRGKCRHLDTQPNERAAVIGKVVRIGQAVALDVRTTRICGVRPPIVAFGGIIVLTSCAPRGGERRNCKGCLPQVSSRSAQNARPIDCGYVDRRTPRIPSAREKKFRLCECRQECPAQHLTKLLPGKMSFSCDGISRSQGSRQPLSEFDRESRTQVLADAGRPCTSAKSEGPCQPQFLPERKPLHALTSRYEASPRRARAQSPSIPPRPASDRCGPRDLSRARAPSSPGPTTWP